LISLPDFVLVAHLPDGLGGQLRALRTGHVLLVVVSDSFLLLFKVPKSLLILPLSLIVAIEVGVVILGFKTFF